MTASPETTRSTGVKQNEEKWTPTLMRAGYLVLPTVLLERQQALGLEAVDINILLHLIRHWWFADKLPHPSKKTIAECMGISRSTVQRRIAAMERDGLIKRVQRHGIDKEQQTNIYDLSGLIAAASPYAEESLNVRASRRADDAARRTRKRPMAKESRKS
jgi:hypothetical protein